jgi:hypothetical protein
VAFLSSAALLAVGPDSTPDVYVYDRDSDEIVKASVASGGASGNDSSGWLEISGDGKFVAFASRATNLVSNDTNGERDIFIRDLVNGQTSRASVAYNLSQANDQSNNPAINADGRFVTFVSDANNLVLNDTNFRDDIFAFDRLWGQPQQTTTPTKTPTKTPTSTSTKTPTSTSTQTDTPTQTATYTALPTQTSTAAQTTTPTRTATSSTTPPATLAPTPTLTATAIPNPGQPDFKLYLPAVLELP